MAVCDGDLDEKERRFLATIAGRLGVPIDLEEVDRRAQDYRVTMRRNVAMKTADNVKTSAVTAGGKVRGKLGRVFKRGLYTSEVSIVSCSNCEREVPAEQRLCPDCGRSPA